MPTPPLADPKRAVGENTTDNAFDSSAVVANPDGSTLERLEHLLQNVIRSANTTTPAVLATGTTVFTVAGGPIWIQQLVSYCIVTCDGTAATLQWSADGTVGAATTFTAASGSLASFVAGGIVYCNFANINTAPVITQTAGVALSSVITQGIIVPPGIITTTIGSGPSTGTFLHYMRYQPLGLGVTVTPAF